MGVKKVLIIVGIILSGMYINWFLSGWINSIVGGDRDIWTLTVTLVMIYPYILLYRLLNKKSSTKKK
jgi:hypothetical protein